jgi:hypothetical protein
LLEDRFGSAGRIQVAGHPAESLVRDAARDRVVDGLIGMVEKTGEMSDDPKTLLFNCISQTYALVHRLPLVERSAWLAFCSDFSQ